MATRVYKYGLLPPTLEGERVSEQIWLAHRYYNDLVELERNRRAVVRSILSAHPTVEPLEAEAAELLAQRDAAHDAIRQERKATRKRKVPQELTDTYRAARDALKAKRAELKAAKQALREDTVTQEALRAVNERATVAQKGLRASCGCYWGTYLQAEQAIDQARKTATVDPSFRRWSGSGAIAVQTQGGLTWQEVSSCSDRRLQIDPTLRPCGSGKGKHRPRVRLRVGSVEREPIWAEWPLILHRPIPEAAQITWAKVVRERLGGKDRWSLHLTLRLPDDWRREQCGTGSVAVDLGWRQMEGGIRVAYLADDGGRAEQVLLEAAIVSAIRKADDLRSIRDLNFNAARDKLATWLRENEAPDWVRKRTTHLHQWRAPARLAALALAWREARWSGDEEAYTALEAWRKQDKHLWTWEVNQRDKAHRRRREQYRVLGAQLARTYRVLALERFDLRVTQKHVAVDSEDTEIQAARLQQRLTAPSELRECLVQAFAARGGVVAEIPAHNTTRACHACGQVNTWDAVTYLHHTCSCGEQWDQDYNACRNLLAARERLDGDSDHDGARIKDYGKIGPPKESKWGKLGRHKQGRSQTDMEAPGQTGV